MWRFNSVSPAAPKACLWFGWEDVPQRDVGGFHRQRARQLRVVMGGHAEPQPGAVNGRQIGGIEIFLAQMHAVGAVLDRQPPVVVDEQSRLITPAQRDGGSDVLFDLLIRQILMRSWIVVTPASSRRAIHSTLSTTG